LVHAQADTGTFNITVKNDTSNGTIDNFTIKSIATPIGSLSYANNSSDLYPDPDPYDGDVRLNGTQYLFSSPLLNAEGGAWLGLFPARQVYGHFAGGSGANKTPIEDNGTYSGFSQETLFRGTIGRIDGKVSVSILVIASGVTLKKYIDQFSVSVPNCGVIAHKGASLIEVPDDGTASFRVLTGCPNVVNSNPTGDVALKFYGPEWLQVTGTFSGLLSGSPQGFFASPSSVARGYKRRRNDAAVPSC
jgi:hypothetical protein